MKCIPRYIGLFTGLALLHVSAGARADDYQAYYLYLGNDPSNLESEWSDWPLGLAHDDANWYIATLFELWRVPVGQNLNSFHAGTPGVLRRADSSYPALVAEDYGFVGDPCLYRFNGTDYLIVPINSSAPAYPPGVAVFLADSLTYVDHAPLTFQNGENPTFATWCAVDEMGTLYSSEPDEAAHMKSYELDWELLDSSGVLALEHDHNVLFYDENLELLFLHNISGGEFTEDGQLLYVVADGIHVFATGPWCERVQQSTNGSGYFNFEFNGGFPVYEDPQGLALWDLEGTGSPHQGQLHVMLWDTDVDASDISIKHYTNVIRVQQGAPPPWTGTPLDPFPSVTAGANAAWSGSELRINAGVYNEVLTIDQRFRLTSVGGVTRIGG